MTRLACTVVVLVAAASTAWAQDFEAAGKHFSAAQEAFGAKHFKTAATEFEAAYAITKDPVLLYNVAESYEKAGDGHKAVANYKAYLKEQPNAQDRAEVQRRVAAIEQKHYRLVDQSAPGDNPPAKATTAPSPTKLPPTPTPPPAAPSPPTPPPALKEPGAGVTPPSTSAAPPSTAPVAPQSTAPKTTETTPTTTPPPVVPSPEAAAPTPAPPPAAVPQATPPPAEAPPGLIEEGPMTKLRVAAWIGVAATLAVLTAGAIFGLAAESRADEINRRLSFVDMNNQPHKFDQSTQSDLQSLKDDGNLYNGLAIGFYSVAAASAVATVTMFVVDAKRPKHEKQRAWRIAPVVGKNAAGFAFGGSF